MSKIKFYAGCDFGGNVNLQKINPATSDTSPLTNADGVVTFVISLTKDGLTPALTGLSQPATYIGAVGAHVAGDWSWFFNGLYLVRANLDALNTTQFFLLCIKTDDTWEYQELEYVRVKPMTLA